MLSTKNGTQTTFQELAGITTISCSRRHRMLQRLTSVLTRNHTWTRHHDQLIGHFRQRVPPLPAACGLEGVEGLTGVFLGFAFGLQPFIDGGLHHIARQGLAPLPRQDGRHRVQETAVYLHVRGRGTREEASVAATFEKSAKAKMSRDLRPIRN